MKIGIILDTYSLNDMIGRAKASAGLCQAFAETDVPLTWYVPSINPIYTMQALMDLAKIVPGRHKFRSIDYLPGDCENGEIDVLQTLPSFSRVYLEVLTLQRQGLLNVPIVCPIHAINEGVQDTFRFAVAQFARNTSSPPPVTVVFPTQSCLELYTKHLSDLGLQEVMSAMTAEVIPHPIESAWFDPPQVPKNARIDIPEGKIVIGFLGRLTPVFKADLMPLLMLLKRLLRHRGDYHLVIAGADENAYASMLWNAIDELELNETNAVGLREHLTLLTDLSEDEVHGFYESIDIFVSLVDNTQESYGLTPLQAMAYEKPVVLSRWTGYCNLVEDGKNGFLVDTYVADYNESTEAILHLFNRVESNYLSGQSTAIDLSQAEKIVNFLADRPDVRKQIGRSARQSAWELASVETVSARYKALWTEISTATRHPSATNANGEIAPPMRMRVAPSLPREMRILRARQDNPAYIKSQMELCWVCNKSIVDAIFSIVEGEALTLRKILAGFQDEKHREVNWHILWLLKHGFLETATVFDRYPAI